MTIPTCAWAIPHLLAVACRGVGMNRFVPIAARRAALRALSFARES